MLLDQSHLSCCTLLIFIIVPYAVPSKNALSCIIVKIRCYVYKIIGINSAILVHLFVNSVILIFKVIFKVNLYNVNSPHQTFKNCFVIILYHLTKDSSWINKCIIFEPNELSITEYLLYGIPYLLSLIYLVIIIAGLCSCWSVYWDEMCPKQQHLLNKYQIYMGFS